MSFGRGRGRGFGRGGFHFTNKLPFELFPDIEGLGTARFTTENREQISWSAMLHRTWKNSPYYYEDKKQQQESVQKSEIEKYSDRRVLAERAKAPMWHYMKLEPDYFPAELVMGTQGKKSNVKKKVKWDLKKLDEFEKLEQKYQGNEKEEEEEEEEAVEEEEEGDYSDEGDYEQNVDFDDDDDGGMDDVGDGDDEGYY